MHKSIWAPKFCALATLIAIGCGGASATPQSATSVDSKWAAPSTTPLPTTIVFGGKSFTAAQKQDANGELLVEFYLPGEKGDAWTQLVDFRAYPSELKPQDAVSGLVANIKSKYPSAPLEPLGVHGKVGLVIDTMLTSPDGLEHNLFWYYATGSGRTVQMHYARRVPGAALKGPDARDKLRAGRKEALEAMSNLPYYAP